MIKSKPRNTYYGTLAYADGEVKKVVEYTLEKTEGADGIKTQEFWRLKGDGYYSKIVSVEAYKIMTALDTVTAVVKVDGRTYIGHSQCDPNDDFDGAFGRQLALARAMHDHATIKHLEELSNWNGWCDVDDDDADGDSSDIDFEPDGVISDYVAADGDDEGSEYCCHCGKRFNAADGIQDDYTDDVYCSHDCYIAAGGNIDPDGEDDSTNNYCDYCLEDIPDGVGIEDADGHVYCCQECYEKAVAEKEMDGDDEEEQPQTET